MECLKEDRILKFRPDTLEAVRKELNLEKPERMKEAIDILENWVQKQLHFTKKDFSRDYLERNLVSAKGLVERAKDKLDKLCTFKTLVPEFFKIPDLKTELEPLQNFIIPVNMPYMTTNHHRIFVTKTVSDKLDSATILAAFKFMIMLSEYLKRAEYCNGFQVILDYSDINILNYVTCFNFLDLRKIIAVITEGYGCRIKGIHVISSSKYIETIMSLLKQVFSAKLVSRIHLHKNADSLVEFVPKEFLPANYGGKQKSVEGVYKDWLDALYSKEFVDYVTEMYKANTDESLRQANKFNENCLGMPGSFRALSVD